MYAVHYYEIVNELLKTVLVTILVTHPGNYTVVRVTSYLFQLSQISREITKTVSEGRIPRSLRSCHPLQRKICYRSGLWEFFIRAADRVGNPLVPQVPRSPY